MTALRPVTLADTSALDSWRTDSAAAGAFQWFGFLDLDRLRGLVERRETLTADDGVLAVVDDDGRLVGDVSWMARRTGPLPTSRCWNIGIWLLPEHRGCGHGAAAQRLLAAYLFDHTTVERVEADTDVDNLAEQRALERAGFSREGVLRRVQYRAGSWHDMVVYSRLRGEP